MAMMLKQLLVIAALGTSPALAAAPDQPPHPDTGAALRAERVDAATVRLICAAGQAVDVFASADPALDSGDVQLAAQAKCGALTLPLAATARSYLLVRDASGTITPVAERELPLAKGSNFRDVGGYLTKDGRSVRWGKLFRSGALPVLTEGDYTLLGGLGITTIVDLRSLEEREVAPTQLDDRTGALFVANDYSLRPLMANLSADLGMGENFYAGMEKLIRPQIRQTFNRILADEGAVMFHCSAGQDRTGVTAALILLTLGVDRDTVLRDYHLSTALRRPENELPPLNPADYPTNPIVQYYAAAAKKPDGLKAEPLFTKSGQSHMVQFLDHLDRDYGGVSAYLDSQLGIDAGKQDRLRTLLLQ